MIHCQAGCVRRDRHLPDCPGDCTGCEPRMAAVGLRVCERDRENVWDALRGLETLWVDVEASGVLKGAHGGTRGRSGHPLPIDPDATDWRGRVKACLIGWCKVLEEDWQVSLDDAQDTVGWLAGKVRYHADRILAHPEHADQLVADLCGWDEDGRRHEGLIAEGRRLMGRGGAKPLTILCDCGDRVRVETDPDADMTCRTCGETGVWAWWRRRLAPETEAHMTGAQVVAWLRTSHRITIEEATLRQWVSRGKLVPLQREAGQASTYLPEAVAIVAMNQMATRIAR